MTHRMVDCCRPPGLLTWNFAGAEGELEAWCDETGLRCSVAVSVMFGGRAV